MKKMPTLFKRNFDKRPVLAYDEVTPGCEWVLNGDGSASVKHDGTACAIVGGKLYKRYDIRPSKSMRRKMKRGKIDSYPPNSFADVPDGAILCNESPDLITGHWPCWIPVDDEPESKWFQDGFTNTIGAMGFLSDGTYELVGPKIGKNPEGKDKHMLLPHGCEQVNPPRDFDDLSFWLERHPIEGVVFKHPDGRMCKIKKKDFGLVR